jgi:hypothetical protein
MPVILPAGIYYCFFIVKPLFQVRKISLPLYFVHKCKLFIVKGRIYERR